jgi:hypothetical protein
LAISSEKRVTCQFTRLFFLLFVTVGFGNQQRVESALSIFDALFGISLTLAFLSFISDCRIWQPAARGERRSDLQRRFERRSDLQRRFEFTLAFSFFYFLFFLISVLSFI